MASVATDHANSFQAQAFRVCNLDATSTPVTATTNFWTSNQFISVGFTPTYQAGADVAQLAADGTLCADYKAPDMLRYAAISVAICNPEPELRAMLGGGVLFTPPPGSGAVSGYGAPQRGSIPQPNGVAIEAWSRAVVNGKQASVNPYWYWVFPYCQIWPVGETRLENGLPAFAFQGYAYGNANFGTGPTGLWPFTSDRAYQFARASALPTINNGWN